MSERRLLLGAEVLLPLAVIGSAILLVISETMTTFELVAAGDVALEALEAADRHAYAMVVLGALAIAGTAVAMTTGSRPAAIATAVAGLAALLIFLTVDLPDVNRQDVIEDPIEGFRAVRVEPQGGFWLSGIAAILLSLTGGAYATLTPVQLRAPLDRLRGRDPEPDPEPDEPDPSVSQTR